jgi:hypothetical protein
MPLVPRRLSASRRLPHLSWAWPRGSRERLVIAAGHADEARAAEAFVEWLAVTDLGACAFPELRLLVRIASRFPETHLKVAERARLNGTSSARRRGAGRPANPYSRSRIARS